MGHTQQHMGCSSSAQYKAEEDAVVHRKRIPAAFTMLQTGDTCCLCLEEAETNCCPQCPNNTATETKNANEANISQINVSLPPNLTPQLVKILQDADGGPWVRLDCSHVCHSECLRARVAACRNRHPADKLTFGQVIGRAAPSRIRNPLPG